MSKRLVIADREQVEGELPVDRPWWQFSVRYNVSPSQSVPVVRAHENASEGVMMRWGLVPASAKGDPSQGGCARLRVSELGSGDFKAAWFHGRRGILPIAGFYLWQPNPVGFRQPYYVRLVNRLVFGVAVLWERSVSDEDDVIESCALLTVPANALLAELGGASASMPAILRREDYDPWLHSRVADAKDLLATYPQARMVSHPVGPYVNDSRRDGPELIQRIELPAESAAQPDDSPSPASRAPHVAARRTP